MIVNSPLSKIALLIGFISAFIGYSFWDYLWNSAFYQFIAFAFVSYTFAIFNECQSITWKKIALIPLVASINALTDELFSCGYVFNWSEYVSLGFIAIYLYLKK